MSDQKIDRVAHYHSYLTGKNPKETNKQSRREKLFRLIVCQSHFSR